MDLDLSVLLNKKDLSLVWEILSKLGFEIRQPIRKEEFINPKKLLSVARKKDAKAISFIHSRQPYLVVDILFEEAFQISDRDT